MSIWIEVRRVCAFLHIGSTWTDPFICSVWSWSQELEHFKRVIVMLIAEGLLEPSFWSGWMDWPLRISADDTDNVMEKRKIREKPTNPLTLVWALTTSKITKEREKLCPTWWKKAALIRFLFFLFVGVCSHLIFSVPAWLHYLWSKTNSEIMKNAAHVRVNAIAASLCHCCVSEVCCN